MTASPVVATPQLAKWVTDDADAKLLGSPVQVSGYEIRPPVEYRFIKQEKQPANIWVGTVRPDETYPTLSVLVMDLPESEAHVTIDRQFESVLGALRRHNENWQAERVEHGSIGGIHFVQTSWSGVATSAARPGLAGRKRHGIALLGVDGRKAIQVHCQDVSPEHVESLRLGKLAARSIRRVPAEGGAPR